MSRSPNMQRVAEAAGVSKSSVSLALRDDPRLALETRRRVQEVAARLGYRKNPVIASLMAQLRVSQNPKFQANFALINCSDNRTLFDAPQFAELRRGIRERADKAGYGVEEFWAHEPGLRLTRLRQILHARNIRGLVVAAMPGDASLLGEQGEFYREFCFAAIGIAPGDSALPLAANDHFQTARAALMRVHALGYGRPALAVAERRARLFEGRLSAGFAAAWRELGLPGMPSILHMQGQGDDRAGFSKWWRAVQADVLLTDQARAREWVQESGGGEAGMAGLLHLDWTPNLRDWAGMDQHHRQVGAAAADMVIQQMTNNEIGLAEHRRVVLIESGFVAGPSLRAEAPRAAPGEKAIAGTARSRPTAV